MIYGKAWTICPIPTETNMKKLIALLLIMFSFGVMAQDDTIRQEVITESTVTTNGKTSTMVLY